jgi:hypothetical protein
MTSPVRGVARLGADRAARRQFDDPLGSAFARAWTVGVDADLPRAHGGGIVVSRLRAG